MGIGAYVGEELNVSPVEEMPDFIQVDDLEAAEATTSVILDAEVVEELPA